MRFHGIMVVRDEDDIIAQCLEHLLTWADAIYIHDLGSTDSTWDIIQDYARRDPRIIPYRSEPLIFNDNMRGNLFNEYRDRFNTDDWILRVDADEFYHITPPAFVQNQLRFMETAVHLQWYYFRLTRKEVEAYESGQINLLRDRTRPIEQRRTFYKIADYAEPRMFRYRRSMSWPVSASFPINAGYVARERLPIRHYPHRDPLQMMKRFRLRASMMKLAGVSAGAHWRLDDWHKEVLETDETTGQAIERTASHEGLSSAKGHTTGDLLQWTPGSPLPEVHTTKHLQPWPLRMIQRVIHPLLLPIIDSLRPPFQGSPTLCIPGDITIALQRKNAEDLAAWQTKHP